METPSGPDPTSGPVGVDPSRVVYVVSQDASAGRGDELDLFKLGAMWWRGRWLILGITVVVAAGSAVYASLLTPAFTASVVMAPVKDEALSGLASQLGGLASLAGIGTRATDNTEAVAVLRSRDFAREFIEAEALVPSLFPDSWDASANRWKIETPPDSTAAAGFFVSRVRRIEEDARSGLVTISVEWRDPELAAKWANTLAERLNEHMRQRALTDAERNVKYLRQEFESTSLVALQQSISGLLESEMQKLMLARGNEEYAYRIIDRAVVPRAKSKPRTTLIVAVATVFGAMLGAFVVLLRDMVQNRAVARPRI